MSDDPEIKRQEYERAKAVLDGAGWLFDAFVNAEMRKVLTSDPDDMTAREVAYNRARVATELKTGLLEMTQAYESEQQIAAETEKRQKQFKEKTHGG